MFKAYQFKWFFILSVIITVGSLLIRQSVLQQVHWWEFIIYGIHIASLIFICWMIHGYFLLHKIASFNNYAKYSLSILLAGIMSFVVNYFLMNILPKTILIEENEVGFHTLPNIIFHLTSGFYLSIVCYILFNGFHANSALQKAKLENEILEQAHLRAQLISLQQQISPHFLFNSLSTLKTIANDYPTKNYIMQLSAVYRYVLNYNEHYLTPLSEELTFIKSYLYIMNQRFDEAMQVTINIPDDNLTYLIPPLSLQLLLENALKHNMISLEQPLCITIVTDTTPALIVTNNFQPKKFRDEGTGTGLKNITERCKLLMHRSVKIVNEAGYFSVTLPLLKQ